jgi:succinyl-diaminopimelate desuccinylase
MVDALALATALLACPSVTPARGPVFDVLEAALRLIGFDVERFTVGEAPDGPVENLLAVRGTGGRHLAFAGHVDVVPPGEGWTGDAFVPEVRGGLLHGRGAVDMKGAIAAFVAAAARTAPEGTLSLIITGDEEGPAVFGTRALIERMAARGIRPDLCLVGEPTSDQRFGDTVKIGRRGSVNIWIEVPGRQGHVAYPHLADNPITPLVAALAEIDALVLDTGNAWFQPSNIEITDLAVGNPATNVIPARAAARLSIRFNDLQRGDALAAQIDEIVRRHAGDGADLGRGIPDEAGRALVLAVRRDRGPHRCRAATLHHRRHVGRALPLAAMPHDRIRLGQRYHAQGERGGGGGRPLRPDRHLCRRDQPRGRRLSRGIARQPGEQRILVHRLGDAEPLDHVATQHA